VLNHDLNPTVQVRGSWLQEILYRVINISIITIIINSTSSNYNYHPIIDFKSN